MKCLITSGERNAVDIECEKRVMHQTKLGRERDLRKEMKSSEKGRTAWLKKEVKWMWEKKEQKEPAELITQKEMEKVVGIAHKDKRAYWKVFRSED
ncbi:hypothetical protein NPIL_614781 [Nephila pilipes]|uniref:Uncharacterized protein n=1 Tax=Nephila pilipes TaxID=299642 RepID=A0A8X6PF96_NEPPI|nr:hypothetical protein NPIL_614781 [Nephila pilipes]